MYVMTCEDWGVNCKVGCSNTPEYRKKRFQASCNYPITINKTYLAAKMYDLVFHTHMALGGNTDGEFFFYNPEAISEAVKKFFENPNALPPVNGAPHGVIQYLCCDIRFANSLQRDYHIRRLHKRPLGEINKMIEAFMYFGLTSFDDLFRKEKNESELKSAEQSRLAAYEYFGMKSAETLFQKPELTLEAEPEPEPTSTRKLNEVKV